MSGRSTSGGSGSSGYMGDAIDESIDEARGRSPDQGGSGGSRGAGGYGGTSDASGGGGNG